MRAARGRGAGKRDKAEPLTGSASALAKYSAKADSPLSATSRRPAASRPSSPFPLPDAALLSGRSSTWRRSSHPSAAPSELESALAAQAPATHGGLIVMPDVFTTA